MTGSKIMNAKHHNTMAVTIEGVEIHDGWQQDERSFGHNTHKQITGATYGMAGPTIGAKCGALAGGKIGLLFKGVGTAPGAIIGGVVFGILGGIYGKKWTEEFFDVINDNKEKTNE